MTANTVVLHFPVNRIVRLHGVAAAKLDSINETEAKQEYLDELIEDQTDALLQAMFLNGVNIKGEEFNRMMAVSIECLRAATYKTIGLDHPLSEHIEQIATEIEKTYPVKE